jgi:hypothetical protein
MKAKLLRNVRSRVKLINWHKMPAKPTDKLVTIEIEGLDDKKYIVKTLKGKTAYFDYKTACKIRRNDILSIARELKSKSWIWHVFN